MIAANTLGLNAYLTGFEKARFAKLYIPRSRDVERGGGKRGKVTTFSAGSRRRMLERIHTVERDAKLPCFVTMTFPDLFPDQQEAKRCLDNLFKRWKRRWPNTSCIWRMEVVDRKSGANAGKWAPHFHLLVWGHFDGELASQDWFKICGSDQHAHLKHGTDVQELESWKGAVFYCAKYAAKVSDVPIEGRAWGVHNRKCMPVQKEAEATRIYLPRPAVWRVRRAFQARCRSTSGRDTFCAKLFTETPERWMEHARREVEAAIDIANSWLQCEAERLTRIDSQCRYRPENSVRASSLREISTRRRVQPAE